MTLNTPSKICGLSPERAGMICVICGRYLRPSDGDSRIIDCILLSTFVKQECVGMPRYHRYRYGPRLAPRGRPLHGAIWMIGLGILFFTGHWWPGILILVGISAILGAVWRDSDEAPTLPQNDWERPAASPVAPASQPVVTAPPAPTPTPVNSAPRVDLLPSTCPRCGAPVRSNEIKWTSTHSATCTYCGSNLMTGNKPS